MTGGIIDGGGCTAFYRAHYAAWVRRALRDANGNLHDAEDIVQDSFAALAKQWDTANEPLALLTTIYRRRVIKHWNGRRTGAVPAGLDLGALAERLPAVGVDPSTTAERLDEVRRAAARLSRPEQQIIAAEAAGYSRAEIAAGTGGTPRKVGAAISCMRARVRQADASEDETYRAFASNTTFLMWRWEAAILLLPPRQQQVYRLAAAGCRPADIAEQLQISAENARTNLHYAKKTVGKKMEDLVSSRNPLVSEPVLDLLDFWLTPCRCCKGSGFSPRDAEPRCLPNAPRHGQPEPRGRRLSIVRCTFCDCGLVPVWKARQWGDFADLGLPAIPDNITWVNKRGQIIPYRAENILALGPYALPGSALPVHRREPEPVRIVVSHKVGAA